MVANPPVGVHPARTCVRARRPSCSRAPSGAPQHPTRRTARRGGGEPVLRPGVEPAWLRRVLRSRARGHALAPVAPARRGPPAHGAKVELCARLWDRQPQGNERRQSNWKRRRGFRVGELLARGAMGAVYLGSDREGRRVALKLLSPELAHDERFRQRFLRESRLAATLDHPNVVRTIASGDDGGVLYLAMVYVNGTDLRELLRREGRLEPRTQSSGATGRRGARHGASRRPRPSRREAREHPRRAQPDGERAYVCDFGLARHVSSVGSLTGDRGFVGTVDYVAPEQIRGGSVDARATSTRSAVCSSSASPASVRTSVRATSRSSSPT